MEDFELIKKFSFNTKLDKYIEYVNFFHKLDLDAQTNIISIMIKYKIHFYCHYK